MTEQPLHERLRELARKDPDKPALYFYGKRLTYRELDEASDRFANALLDLGVQKGEPVVLFLQNCPQYLVCHYGIQKMGAIVVPSNPMFKEMELEYLLKDLDARVIVTLDDLVPIVDNVWDKTRLQYVIATRYQDFLPAEPVPDFPGPLAENSHHPGTLNLLPLLSSASNEPPSISVNMDDVCLIVYTSGTTGLPKGAMLTYRNAQFKTECLVQAFRFTKDDTFLSVMPLFHIAGMLFSVNASIYSGGTNVLLNRFTPETFMDAIERYNVTVAYTVVPMNIAVLNHPKAKETDFRSLRLNPCTSFGIQLTEDISNQWKALTGVGLFETAYGLSETHTADAIMPVEAVKFGTVGKPTFQTEIKIVSLEDPTQEMPVGEQGEILVRNPGVFKGYWKKEEETANVLRDGWLFTGDIGKLDEDGYLYFLGRSKEMIKCSGYSVFPEDVERLLLHHPAVAQVAVVGVPDPVRGETVKACIVLKPEFQGKVDENAIIEWSKEHMAAYKYPRIVEFRDTLPMTSTGKLLRRLLKTQLSQLNCLNKPLI
jgi:long-chain acyl-CoA synthetase